MQADIQEVKAALQEPIPRLPTHYLYDERGSQLFEAITELPEYYLTRTETEVLETHATKIAQRIGPGCELIEYGSGSSHKTEILLTALERPAVYTPIDVSGDHLDASAERIRASYPDLDVQPLCANFMDELKIPREARGTRVGFFPGSTLGNLNDVQARELLARMARTLGRGALLLIGVDLVKPEEILVPAYDDSQGVTAKFILNILPHIWELTGLKANVEDFRLRAIWNPEHSRMELWIEALRNTRLELEELKLDLAPGQRILIEYSTKYTRERLLDLAQDFEPVDHWTDSKGWFLVQLLKVR
jgi:dimethylhistidine N-methyltransferase